MIEETNAFALHLCVCSFRISRSDWERMVWLLELILAPGNYGQLRSRQGDQFRTSQDEAGLKKSAVWGAETCAVVRGYPAM